MSPRRGEHLQAGGLRARLGALVKVTSMQNAQLAISHLHKSKVGPKRINISHGPADDSLPKKEVIALLQSVPGGEIALFKFRQMYEEIFRSTISVAELHRMNEVVTITDDVDGVGRMVQLKTDEVFGFGKLEQELVFCEVHRPTNQTGDGVGKVWEGLPDVVVELRVLSVNIHKILKTHEGSVPLGSLLHCYNAECSPPLQEVGDDSAGVALEHLLQAVKGVLITTGSTGIKKLVEAVPDNIEIKYSDLVGPPPALAGQLLVFTREVVDMLKFVPGCKIHFCTFIPRYHHHFGKQCRVADYGYTKLKDLLESIPHVIQIIGEGSKTVITLAHKAQVKRFSNDLLKMLKSQPDRKFHLSSFAFVYENCFYKPFNVSDYGVCYVKDILSEIPENIIATKEVNHNDLLISVFKRDQTEEEVIKTRGFAKEVVELLRHSPDLSIRFHKFIPAYHQHFGRQCRVGNYGMTKLVELFEAVSDTVELKEVGEERIVQLTKEKMIFRVGWASSVFD